MHIIEGRIGCVLAAKMVPGEILEGGDLLTGEAICVERRAMQDVSPQNSFVFWAIESQIVVAVYVARVESDIRGWSPAYFVLERT